ncbi:MAG: hypothetical protein N2C14_10760 [Planctomycetales bacterium]
MSREIGKRQVTIRQLLLWTLTSAGMMTYCRLMPLGTMIPEQTTLYLTFTLFFSGLGGASLAGLLWLTPSVLRGEVAKRAPGEILLMAVGVLIIMDCAIGAWLAATRDLDAFDLRWFTPDSLACHRARVVWFCVFAVPIFLAAGLICRGDLAWRLALLVPIVPCVVWGTATYVDRQTAGLGFFVGQRDPVVWLQFLSPILPAVLLAFVVARDWRREPRSAGHWLGVILFMIIAGKVLETACWDSMFHILSPWP